ncbi:hypothetical protein ABH942_000149 [Flavobacterium sp. 28YEA47A]|uniref:hypothetical protein n=1 Tax=Flavobacterium sp. 28YEA47A TaxID=3156276 RepID=UPI00351674C9
MTLLKVKNNIWKEFAKETGGSFVKGYSWHSDRTEIEHNKWLIVFDNYTIWSGKLSTKVTRIIAPIISADNFQFEIYRADFTRKIEKLFGAQDVEIGYPEFDKAFIIKSNNEFKTKSLLRNKKIRDSIALQKDVNILISDQKGIWEEKLPDNNFELNGKG